MTRHRWMMAGAATVALLSPKPAAGQQGERVARAPDTSSVILMYDEQDASDATRATIARLLIGTTPDSGWARADVPVAEPRQTTVLRLYRYYTSAYPLTTSVLIAAVDSANALGGAPDWGGQTIKAPPVPQRGYTRFDYSAAFREFDVGTKEYASFSARAGTKGVAYLLVDTARSAAKPASTDVPVLDGTITAVVVRMRDGVLDLARKLLGSVAKGQVSVSTRGGIIRLDLFDVSRPAAGAAGTAGAAGAPPCSYFGDWLAQSPYRSIAKSRIAAMSPADIAALSKKAATLPLRIVDWHIDGHGGHGDKVLDVATEMLDTLGVPGLKSSIRTVELDPAFAKDSLASALASFEAYKAKQPGGLRQEATYFTAASQWLAASPKPQAIADVHEQVLRAVLWAALERDSGVVNLSFGAPEHSLALEPPTIKTSGSVFGVLAAGNTVSGLTYHTSIQNVASRHRALVNVTAASPSGVVEGAYSDLLGGTLVTLSGPRCGYSAGTLGPDDSGSSFASPFVAAAAWVSHLLDWHAGEDFRDRLMMASWPFPKPTASIESEGTFDPWLLLAWPVLGPHVQTPGKAIEKVMSVDLTIEIGGAQGGTELIHDRKGASLNAELVLSDVPGDNYAWFRDPQRRDIVLRGPLVRATGKVVLANRTIIVNAPGDLKASLRALLY